MEDSKLDGEIASEITYKIDICRENYDMPAKDIISKYPGIFKSIGEVNSAFKHPKMDVETYLIRREVYGRLKSKVYYSSNDVINKINEIIEYLGELPDFKYFMSEWSFLYNYAKKHFGSWSSALLKVNNVEEENLKIRWKYINETEEIKHDKLVALLEQYKVDTGSYPSCREIDNIASHSDEWPCLKTCYNILTSEETSLLLAKKKIINAKVAYTKKRTKEAVKKALDKDPALSVTELAEVTGLSYTTLKRYGDLEGKITMTSLTERTRRILQAIADEGFPLIEGAEKGRDYAIRMFNGETGVHIAEEAGLSSQRIYQYFKKYLGAYIAQEGFYSEKFIDSLYKAYLKEGNKVFTLSGYDTISANNKSYPKFWGSSWKKVLEDFSNKYIDEIDKKDIYLAKKDFSYEEAVDNMVRFAKKYGLDNLKTAYYTKVVNKTNGEFISYRILNERFGWKSLKIAAFRFIGKELSNESN